MNKFICVLSSLLLLFSMCACTSQQQANMQQANMTISPSEFSKETKEVLNLIDVGDEIRFFDIKMDDSVKSLSMVVWVYQNGEWKETGRIKEAAESLETRIAIRLTENSCDMYMGNSSAKYNPVLEGNFGNSVSQLDEILNREIPLELNKETPIWVKIGTDMNSMSVGGITDNFRQIDCNAGVAVTLTVSDKTIE